MKASKYFERRSNPRVPLILSSKRPKRVLRPALCALTLTAIMNLALGCWGAIESFFREFPRLTEQELQGVSAAVVFTGRLERIDEALRLLAAAVIPRLFISGANGSALTPKELIARFFVARPETNRQRAIGRLLYRVRNEGPQYPAKWAETRCWLQRSGVAGPLLLITSKDHMARALLSLSASLPGRSIVPYANDGDAASPFVDWRNSELQKYLVTLVAVHAFTLVSRWQVEGEFSNGCPN